MPVALQFDLIRALVEHGIRSSPGDTVDPSMSFALRDAGVALVTTYIEQLSLVGLVCDPVPMFGSEGGMWIGYRLTDRGRALAATEVDREKQLPSLPGDRRQRFPKPSHCSKANVSRHRSTISTVKTF
jgi:hypothetical protein